jgi:phage terminase large subunit-like protein
MEIEAILTRRRSENCLASYEPYEKQQEFHNLGLRHRERLLRAGNQCGKTMCGAAEVSYHATGDYPTWWQGWRCTRPNRGWIGGPSGTAVREGTQTVLLGLPGAWGTGMIPKSAILDVKMARGAVDVVDTVAIKHAAGASRITFKTYEQGREKWQAATLDWVWFDEEPPEDIYMEGLTRISATKGRTFITFTPLLGFSQVILRFLREPSADRSDTVMTIDDAKHIPAAEREKIIASYRPHEREARTRGTPLPGSGLVFPVPREMLEWDSVPIPRHWARIGGLDFGWDHPTAAVRLVHDRDADCVYVTHTHRAREMRARDHVAALVEWGRELRWAWPHDGLQHDKESGTRLHLAYVKYGLKMLPDRATFDGDGDAGVEAGIEQMLDRMMTNRLKVARHLTDWWDEFATYHRKDGKVIKERDDLMAATRYALMMLRFARPEMAAVDAYEPRRERARSWMAA